MRTLSLVLLVGAAAGCSANVAPATDVADAEAAGSTAFAIVAVERAAGASGEVARAEAVVRVVRARSGAVDDDALRMIGAALDLPAAGACSTAGEARAARAVQLVDVGAVTLEANGASTVLQPRRLPDVAGLASGVFYARAAEPDALPSRARYEVRGAGAQPFAVAATAPGELVEVKVGGRDLRELHGVVPTAGGVEIAWEAGAADDVVYVDVIGAAGATRCAFVDAAGRGTVPAGAFAGEDEGTVAIHRLHREAVRGARGVDAGEVRFDFARVASFARR